jgi:ketosteroid isomerase-like protein
MEHVAGKYARGLRILLILALALMAVAIPASAQKKDKNKNAQSSDPTDDIKSGLHMPDSQAVDQAIGEGLGYWQIGDAENLHKYYADNVVVVSGAWEPPVIGWDNYLRAYQAQRSQVSGVTLDRSNTLIKVNGDTAWATYQFLYSAQMNGSEVQFRGHTTLLLAKQANRWVITLNHSSVVDSPIPPSANPSGPAGPSGNR